MSSSDVTGVEVTQLHQVGSTISGRSGSGHAAAKGLKEGLDTAGGSVNHPVVRAALLSFVSSHVVDGSNKLGESLTNGGINVANVAATARGNDENGATAMKAPLAGTSDAAVDINRQIK